MEANGFDGEQHSQVLPNSGSYFDSRGALFTFDVGPFALDPLHQLESRMQVQPSTNAPLLFVDRRRWRLDLSEIDQIMFHVRDALSLRLPEVAQVDPRGYQVIIRPTIFYVQGSNHGNTWAGGLTEMATGARGRVTVMFFYINDQRRVADWREYLISEAINFYVIAIGRDDLAR